MRGFKDSLSGVFANQSDRCVPGFAGNGMHCASVGLVLHWILIKGSILGDGSTGPSPSYPALDAHSVKLSRQKLRDVAVSGDRLIELHAENKLSREQLLYLKFPIDGEAPAQVHPEKAHDQVSEGSTAADSAV